MAISSVRLILIVAGTAAYLGVAVLGWGGFSAFFSHPALVALAIALFALSGVALFAGGNLSPGVREDRGNRWVLVAFALIGLLGAYLPGYTDRNDFWTFDGEGIRWLGVALFAAGGALRIWPVFVPGRRFSGLLAIQAGHTLVTTGVYSVIRHPSYLGLLVNSLGWGLAFRSGVGVLLTALSIPPLLARQAEAVMATLSVVCRKQTLGSNSRRAWRGAFCFQEGEEPLDQSITIFWPTLMPPIGRLLLFGVRPIAARPR